MADASPSLTTNGTSFATNTETNESLALANLPSDVFTSLSRTFDLATISTLRQVSHTLNAAATSELYTKCFAHRTTDLSTKSLNDLVGVCSSEFGSYVQHITIRASYWRLDELEKQLKERARWESTTKGNGPIFSSQQRKLTEEELVTVEENLNAFKALNADQAQLKVSGKSAALLAEALQALGNQKISIQLEAAQYRQSLTERLPARRLFGKRTDEMQTIMNDTFKTTISAIAQSNVEVEKLHVFNAEHAGHISFDAFFESFANVTDRPTARSTLDSLSIPQPLVNLRSLTLTLSPSSCLETGPAAPQNCHDPDEHQPTTEHSPTAEPEVHALQLNTLRALLSACSNSLASLDIRIRGLSDKHNSDCTLLFSSLPPLPNLRSLHLRGLIISSSALLSLLSAPSATNLVTLGLHYLSLPQTLNTNTNAETKQDTRAWLPIFCQLATMTSLESFEANALYSDRYRTQIFPSSPSSALARVPKEHYTTRIYFEGCPCVTFTGSEVRAKTITPDKDGFTPRDDDGSGKAAPRGYETCRWGAPTIEEEDGTFDVDEVGCTSSSGSGSAGNDDKMWTPIRYKIGKRRPLGSPWLYRWSQVMQWEYALF